jgi:predicted lipoprotein with Yx(FWY)xxD motif
MRATTIIPLAAGAAGLVLITGCGVVDRFGAEDAAEAPAEQAEEGGTADDILNLVIRGHEALGELVTDDAGYTLYRYDGDDPDAGESACYDDCAETWWPVEAAEEVSMPGDASMLGSITRDDDTEQVTLDGWPLYRYADDAEPGHTSGDAAQEGWYAVSPVGTKAQDEGWTEGYCPQGFQVSQHPELGEILTDDEGYTLYRFEQDSNDPPEATCLDECAEAFPPVLNMQDFTFEGVDESLFDMVEREYRLDQVTVNGWPLYRSAEDTAPGDINGHGFNDVWYAVTPTGQIAGGQDQGDDGDDGDSDY